MKKLIVCVAIGVLFEMGCNRHSGANSDDPLAMLASPQAATNYDYPFWNDQLQRKTDAWQKALSFCNQPDHKFLINCQPVLAVAAPRVPFATTVKPNTFSFGPGASPQATP
ncbi:MAG TPA: hypothetical protein VNE82_11785 [Candidatus Binataceae bacterium]|nr:hypothetical protein [Candidatus Binataceae bacterium]